MIIPYNAQTVYARTTESSAKNCDILVFVTVHNKNTQNANYSKFTYFLTNNVFYSNTSSVADRSNFIYWFENWIMTFWRLATRKGAKTRLELNIKLLSKSPSDKYLFGDLRWALSSNKMSVKPTV